MLPLPKLAAVKRKSWRDALAPQLVGEPSSTSACAPNRQDSLTGGQLAKNVAGSINRPEDAFMCAGRAPAWHLQAAEPAQNELMRNSAELVNVPFELPNPHNYLVEFGNTPIVIPAIRS